MSFYCVERDCTNSFLFERDILKIRLYSWQLVLFKGFVTLVLPHLFERANFVDEIMVVKYIKIKGYPASQKYRRVDLDC